MIEEIIRNRRTVKPSNMNGAIIPDAEIETMLEMADWAPTHGRTEPWRFIVLDKLQAQNFCAAHAQLYKQQTIEENFVSATFEKLFHQADMISHLIIVYILPGSNPKIPEVEEVAAGSAAIQNMLLYATSKKISSFWSTGGLTYNPAFKNLSDIPATAKILGLIFLGYTDQKQEGKRKIALTDKIRREV